MFRRSPPALLLALLCAAPLTAQPPPSPTCWLSVRNDTKQTIVVQEIITVNAVEKRAKPRQLYAGEAAQERVTSAGQKVWIVYDPKTPAEILHRANVRHSGQDQLFAVRTERPPGKPITYALVEVKAKP